MSCEKHSEYRAKFRPKVPCMPCWKMWLDVQPAYAPVHCRDLAGVLELLDFELKELKKDSLRSALVEAFGDGLGKKTD